MEEQSHDTVFTLLVTTGRFLTTYRTFLIHPRSSFSNFFSSRSQFTKPGAFLVANICFSFLLGHLIGYELPSFPLNLPYMTSKDMLALFLQNLGRSYPFLIFRFLLGISIFLLIFKRLIRYKNPNSFFLTVFPILCYSSVVYLPILLVKNCCHDVIAKDVLELFSNFLNGVWPKLLAWTHVKCLFFPLLISLTLPFWWLYLTHTGLTFLKLKSTHLWRKLFLACILFFILQFLSALAATTTKNWSTLRDFKTLVFQDIQAALSQRPPNFYKAAILSAKIADNEDMPAFVRYTYKLKEASYFLATPILFEGDTPFTRQVLRELDLRELTSVKSLLTPHLHALSCDMSNPRRQSFLQLEHNLKEAEDLYNSPGFVDFGKTRQIMIGLHWLPFSEPLYSYPLDAKNQTIGVYLAVQPSWITLFP